MKVTYSAQNLLRSLVICTGVLAASVIPSAAHGSPNTSARDLSLDGQWQVGLDRQYTRTVTVPGLAQDATKPSPGTLWYARSVTLPAGDWATAVLSLHGARFAPEVYVDGERVSSAPGGMAPTVHVLRGGNVAPGKTIRLEIALRSLNDLGLRDASAVPLADRWRTNVSSGLWDSATLHVSGTTRLTEVVPFTDFAHRKLVVGWRAETLPPQTRFRAWLEDGAGRSVVESQPIASEASVAEIRLPLSIHPWSPEHPTLYRLHCVLDGPSVQLDETVSTWGFREFTARDKHFYLNGEPVTLRGGTVVWQRFLRNPEAADIAFDPAWFQKHILLRLKSYGANTVRFHLALPPEMLLDLCDRDGLLVQMEWPFFHGIPATAESMTEQWRAWLAVAMRHPSVVIVHGWNESGGAELTKAWSAMDAALQGFPPQVVAHRDTIHIHKYWWSLFENLGLYYDSADQFDRTIMVDEFGGDYLDRNGDPGLYPTVKETFLRFLGRRQTREGRLQFQAEANARVGEYWRRIGAAGVLPFCILGSPEDGGVWFLGSLHDPQPMPVWDALAATFSPQSVSLDLWDRNFTPGQKITFPLHFFNDTAASATLSAEFHITRADAASGTMLRAPTISSRLAAHGHTQQPVTLTLPSTPGNWIISATLQTPVPGVTHPIISSWNVHVLTPAPSPALTGTPVGIPSNEPELEAFLQQNHLRAVPLNDASARVLLTSSATWEHLTPAVIESLRTAVDHGRSVVMLDVGPRDLAQAGRPGELGPLDGSPVLKPGEAYHRVQRLFEGIQVEFNQLPEPESHMHPGAENASLWSGLPNDATWLWNGLRGGLVAPAADMAVSGLNQAAFLEQWTGRGADVTAIRSGTYYSYELAGYYAFSAKPNDNVTIEGLRKRVRFLAEDAPSLAAALDPDSPIRQGDLGTGYQAAASSKASRLQVLATCGKGLTRTAVVAVDFGREQGRVLLSQALTAGRLRRGTSEAGGYGIRHDPAAEQFVLNLLAEAVAPGRTVSP